MTCRISSNVRMILSHLRRENDVIDEVTMYTISTLQMAILRKNLKKTRIINFVIMYNVSKCAIYKTLNSTISMKSCRNRPKIKHVQYKYTICYNTFILVLFLVFFRITLSQNDLFQYSISASLVWTSGSVNFVFGWT